MRKIVISILVLAAWIASLSAQTTQTQADAIVLNYLQHEVTRPYLLYVSVNTPNEEVFSVTTSLGETIKAKYACWVYYLNESESTQSRYLFVKADDGNLLEIIASNDFGPDDLTLWKVVENTTGLTEKDGSAKLLYPNPVDDWLTLPCGENACVEIFDIKGTCVFSGLLAGENVCQLDVSFLNKGIYMVSVSGETYKIMKN